MIFMYKQLSFLIVTWYVFFIFQTTVTAQKEDLSQDMRFFLEKVQCYQRWLDTTGLGKILCVEKVQFQKNKQTGVINFNELELFLLLRTTDVDSAVGLWAQVQQDFENMAEYSLKEALFRAFIHKMEIPSAQANVQIYVNGRDGQRIPCFFVWIWDENGYIKDSLRVNACKAQIFDIEVPPVKVHKVSHGKTLYFSRTRIAEEVFDTVVAFVKGRYPRNKYEGGACAGRYPAIVIESQTETELILSVSDLCREALINSKSSIWCDIAKATGWKSECNDIKRERLTFTFKYIPRSDGSYRLKCDLVGKFGSGVYLPRTSGYMDMDPDFFSFERDYAIEFKNALAKRLH